VTRPWGQRIAIAVAVSVAVVLGRRFFNGRLLEPGDFHDEQDAKRHRCRRS
jgi:hypothetical protein